MRVGWTTRIAFVSVFLNTGLLVSGGAMAEDAATRAGELKLAREQCNDPDPDMRLAYVEKAVDSKDVAIQRICIRLALESDNADIRNLGIRAAMASVSRIAFSVDMPVEMAAAIKKAGSNEKQLADLSNTYVAHDYATLKNGFAVEIEGATVTEGTATWYTLVNQAERIDRYKGQATVTGAKINWTGNAALNVNNCSMDLQLGEGSELKGKLQCGSNWAFPVSAKLL